MGLENYFKEEKPKTPYDKISQREEYYYDIHSFEEIPKDMIELVDSFVNYLTKFDVNAESDYRKKSIYTYAQVYDQDGKNAIVKYPLVYGVIRESSEWLPDEYLFLSEEEFAIKQSKFNYYGSQNIRCFKFRLKCFVDDSDLYPNYREGNCDCELYISEDGNVYIPDYLVNFFKYNDINTLGDRLAEYADTKVNQHRKSVHEPVREEAKKDKSFLDLSDEELNEFISNEFDSILDSDSIDDIDIDSSPSSIGLVARARKLSLRNNN